MKSKKLGKKGKNKRRYIVGVDLGGSSVKSVVIKLRSGKTVCDTEVQLDSLASKGDPKRTLRQMCRVADLALERAGVKWSEIRGVGLCTPGPASEQGVIYRSCNMPNFDNLPIRAKFEKMIGLPVVYSNDCDAATLAEYWHRRTRGIERIVGVFVGTGLGGGKVQRGKLVVGTHGAAMEVGHLYLPPQLLGETRMPKCSCGGLAHAEASISLKGLARHLSEQLALARNRTHTLHGVKDEYLARAKKLLALAGEGDKLAYKLLMAQAKALGHLLHMLACSDDPNLFVIGGGITLASDKIKSDYLEIVSKVFKEVTMESYRGRIGIEWAIGKDAAAAHGAALHARNVFKAMEKGKP